MNVHEKLAKVQGVLKAPKNQYNDFGKYNYRSCEDILEAAKPLCIENGLVLTIADDIIAVGTRVYVKAVATVTDIENSENFSVSAFAREADSKKGMDDAQVTGAASSYARKYALNGLFCIDDTKDVDTNEHKAEQNTRQQQQPPVQQNYQPQQPQQPPVCAACGTPFQPFVGKNGKQYTAAQAEHFAKQSNIDGVARCWSCRRNLGTEVQK